MHKKRPNTIPIFGPGKWLFESRALKVGIFAGEDALPFKGRPRVINFQPIVTIGKESCQLCDRADRTGEQAQRQNCALRLIKKGLLTAQLLSTIDNRLQAHFLPRVRFIVSNNGINGLQRTLSSSFARIGNIVKRILQ